MIDKSRSTQQIQCTQAFSLGENIQKSTYLDISAWVSQSGVWNEQRGGPTAGLTDLLHKQDELNMKG